MPTPYDVPASTLVKKLATELKEKDQIVPPQWAPYVKTGSHAARRPENPEWWYIRCASLLRKIYLKGPIGIIRLRSEYGGRLDRGMRPEHVRRGGGAIIRKALQQLEAAGLVTPFKIRGRILTKEGRQLLDKVSTKVKEDLEKTVPMLKKY